MLEDLANIGEFFGSIAVVVSLIYLAYQIRHNTRTVQAATRESLSQSIVGVNSQLFQDPETTRLWLKGRNDISDLDDVEQSRFSGFVISALLTAESAYFQAKDGFLDEQYQQSNLNWIQWFANQKGIMQMWPGIRQFFTGSFCNYFESCQPSASDT